jgi:hypothetical protein
MRRAGVYASSRAILAAKAGLCAEQLLLEGIAHFALQEIRGSCFVVELFQRMSRRCLRTKN